MAQKHELFHYIILQYMLKALDVRMKRGVDLADHLVGYYQGAQERLGN